MEIDEIPQGELASSTERTSDFPVGAKYWTKPILKSLNIKETRVGGLNIHIDGLTTS